MNSHPSLKGPLVLASTSPYRKAQLALLGLPFEAQKPQVDEDSLKDYKLSPQAFAEKLSLAKTKSIANLMPHAIVLGGDQVVAHRGQILGKPGSHQKARESLLRLQNETHQIITAITLIWGDKTAAHTDITEMKMKALSPEQIERYLKLDEPYDCAGTYKIEKHGITLFESIRTEDFSAITGLPLMAISRILKTWGIETP